MKNPTPYQATHPGEAIKDELKARDIRQKDFALDIDMQPTMLNEVIKGKRSVTADIALLLEEALDIPADFWLRFQTQYEIDQARIRDRNTKKLQRIQLWKNIKEFVPVRFFARAGVLTGDLEEDLNTVFHIYGVTVLSELEDRVTNQMASLPAHYRKSDKLQVDKINLLGWTKLVAWKAETAKAASFNPDSFRDLKSELFPVIYSNSNTRDRVRDVLATYGIKMIFQQKFEKTPVDGYAFWSGNNPAIALTLRHKRIDNFAFTLFHELGHVYLHLSKNREISFLDLESKSNAKASDPETEANDFAKDALIPEELWAELLQEKTLSDESIRGFAAKHQTHPAIVLGRLLYEQNFYAVKSTIDRRLS